MQSTAQGLLSLKARVKELKKSLIPQLEMEFEEKGRKMKRRVSTGWTSGDYFTEMYSTREFHSSDCLQKICRGSGLRQELEGLSGSLLQGCKVEGVEVDRVWDRIRGDLDGAWSLAALEEGVRHARAGKYEEALESYKQALKLDPRNADAFVARGAARAKQGNYDEAIQDFEKALEINPMDGNAAEYKQTIERRKKEREMKFHKPDSRQKIQYREDLFGRVEPSRRRKEMPDEEEVDHALSVLTKNHERRRKSKKQRR